MATKEFNWSIPLLSLVFVVVLTMVFSFIPWTVAWINLMLGMLAVAIAGSIIFRKKWSLYIAYEVGVVLMYFLFAILPFNYAGLNMTDQMITNGAMVLLGTMIGGYFTKIIKF